MANLYLDNFIPLQIGIERAIEHTGKNRQQIIREAINEWLDRHYNGVYFTEDEAIDGYYSIQKELIILELKQKKLLEQKEKLEKILGDKIVKEKWKILNNYKDEITIESVSGNKP